MIWKRTTVAYYKTLSQYSSICNLQDSAMMTVWMMVFWVVTPCSLAVVCTYIRLYYSPKITICSSLSICQITLNIFMSTGIVLKALCYKPEGRGFNSRWGHWIFFNWPNPSSCIMALGSTQPITEMSTRNIPGGKGRPSRKADNLTAIFEPILKVMWDP
jgi:hypothetical protein